ncbi:uncharacterized protein LOC126735286 [Anthonomus grandis grandis]|uniref:uncharacterized protein LOC126735286 n=1 Tax=Anthonomus grandis grandis TaxID=2921223 RepID=UPI002166906E|nr:uncharacterized protein LOC126735286 [Anthonomus grandis grandis]
MDHSLDNYAEFETELTALEEESRKKKLQEKEAQRADLNIETRIKIISRYFLRLSWHRKKELVLTIIRNLNCMDSILRLISYMSVWFGKMATYTNVSAQCKLADPQIIMDHNRSMQLDYLEATIAEDVQWIAGLSKVNQVQVIISLLQLGGGGLQKKIYIPTVKIYNEQVHKLEKNEKTPSQKDLMSVLEEEIELKKKEDQYPKHHQLTIAVDKLRKKWDETILKHTKEVFGAKINEKTDNVEKKSAKTENKKAHKKDKKGGKTATESPDWIQMLPIWIIKKIFDHFDNKTLQYLKKVNNHWAYVCDSLMKDRHGKEFLNEAIAKMSSKVDQEILKEYYEREKNLQAKREPECSTRRRIKKLITRGAVLKEMRPNVPKSKQTSTCLTTSLTDRQDPSFYDPIEKLEVFPRLIREDLLLYKSYPCILKDLNILIDVEAEVEKQKDTLSYSLSQIMSDTFSLSEANLADW